MFLPKHNTSQNCRSWKDKTKDWRPSFKSLSLPPNLLYFQGRQGPKGESGDSGQPGRQVSISSLLTPPPLPPSSPSLPPTLRFANRKLETIRRVRRCYWSRDSVGAARLKPHSGWEAFHAILRETHTLCLSRWVTSSGRPARQQNCYGAQTRVTDEGNREWNMFVPSLVIENDCNLGKCLIILQYSTVQWLTVQGIL